MTKPEDYRWCGYAAALAGNKMARRGIAWLYSDHSWLGKNTPSWKLVSTSYRQAPYERGYELLADPDTDFKERLGFTAEQVEREIARNGKLSIAEVYLHRVRYFSDGASQQIDLSNLTKSDRSPSDARVLRLPH